MADVKTSSGLDACSVNFDAKASLIIQCFMASNEKDLRKIPPAQISTPVEEAALSDQSVIIVGNGASLLETRLGSEIDAHDIVVRFNLFKIGKFAPHVGTKTTVWFNNRSAHPVQVQYLLKHHRFERIYIHTWHDTAGAVRSFEEALVKLDRPTLVAGVSRKLVEQMRLFLGGKYWMFSTGAIGAWQMLQHYRQVTLVGFDWWHHPEKFHYGDDLSFKGTEGKGHQPQLEKLFFDKLVQEDRVRFK